MASHQAIREVTEAFNRGELQIKLADLWEVGEDFDLINQMHLEITARKDGEPQLVLAPTRKAD
jgi:hypothetical protein